VGVGCPWCVEFELFAYTHSYVLISANALRHPTNLSPNPSFFDSSFSLDTYFPSASVLLASAEDDSEGVRAEELDDHDREF